MSPALETVLEAAEMLAEMIEHDKDLSDVDQNWSHQDRRVKEIRQAVALVRGEDCSAIITDSATAVTQEFYQKCKDNPGIEQPLGMSVDNNVAHRVRVQLQSRGLDARTKTIDGRINIFATYTK